jgi:hypothetical protein
MKGAAMPRLAFSSWGLGRQSQPPGFGRQVETTPRGIQPRRQLLTLTPDLSASSDLDDERL